MTQHTHGYQNKTFDDRFSPSIMWALGIAAHALLAEVAHQPKDGNLNITLSVFMVS